MPSVSVILPTYNRRTFLQEAVTSVVEQTFADWELIVADDGSDDGTSQFLDGMRESRVRVVRLEHGGNPGRARNAGASVASGEWVAFLDSDDVWLPTKLELQLDRLAAAPACGWSCTGVQFMDVHGSSIAQVAGAPYRALSGWILEQLISEDATVTTPTVMVRRALLDEVGGFDEVFVQREDRDLMLRLAARSEICALDECLTLVRHHDSRSTNAADVADLHRYNEMAFRKALASATSEDIRTLCARRCAIERVARARTLARDGHYAAALESLAQAWRDDPLGAYVWRSTAGVALRAIGISR